MFKKVLKNLRRLKLRWASGGKKENQYTRETSPPQEKTAKTAQEEKLGIDAGIT